MAKAQPKAKPVPRPDDDEAPTDYYGVGHDLETPGTNQRPATTLRKMGLSREHDIELPSDEDLKRKKRLEPTPPYNYNLAPGVMRTKDIELPSDPNEDDSPTIKIEVSAPKRKRAVGNY